MRWYRTHSTKILERVIVVVLLCSMMITCLPEEPMRASNNTLNIDTAKTMALSQNDDYTKLKNKMELAKVQYSQSVKSIKLKQKNQRTFRWSPLLNFKFPESPDLTEEFEYTYKELELQSEIDMLGHSLTDCVYGIYEKVELCFTKVYVLQEKIAFNEKRIASYEKTLKKNKARLLIGQANQADVDAMQSKLDALKSTLSSDMASFEAQKEKLGLLLGIDVSTSYTFKSPFVDANLNRAIEEQLIS